MNDFSLDFNAKFWVEDIAKRYETQENATIIIYKTLKKEGINIPFPTRTIYLKK